MATANPFPTNREYAGMNRDVRFLYIVYKEESGSAMAVPFQELILSGGRNGHLFLSRSGTERDKETTLEIFADPFDCIYIGDDAARKLKEILIREQR